MLISVIIPAYNAEETIREALDSVAGQTFGDVEIIVVDDASTDGTAAVVRGWCQVSGVRCQKSEVGSRRAEADEGKAEHDRQLSNSTTQQPATPIPRYSHTPILLALPCNSGPAAARNRGVAGAKGEWIAFLDADDAWLPEKLAIQMELARQQPDVAMWCGGVIAEGDGERSEVRSRKSEEETSEHRTSNTEHRTPNGQQQGRFCGDAGNSTTPLRQGYAGQARQLSNLTTVNSRGIRLTEFVAGNPIATSTVLIRKTALDAVGGFDERFRGPEDYDLWMRVAARVPVGLIETPLARYRQYSGSLSMDDRRFLPEVLRVLDKAYGEGGALRGMGPEGRAAGHQHLACAWMAAERGALGRAWALFFKSLRVWPWPYEGAGSGRRWPRLKLVVRFAGLTGKRLFGC